MPRLGSIAMARSELERWKAKHPHVNADPAAFDPIWAGAGHGHALADRTSVRGSKAMASAW